MSAAGRPPFLPAVAGHERPKSFFEGVLRTGRVPTGFLLHGARGRGKHTFARWLSTALFCEAGPLEACGRCRSCLAMASSSHPDIELVGLAGEKTKIPIDRIRALKEWFSLAPFSSERRAAIIDDAHLMSEEAQNSLLKLLEEPPGKGLLILVASEPGGLLETILSRVQRVFFGPLREADGAPLVARLAGTTVERVAEIWPLAEGSPGRALELLDDGAGTLALASARKLFGSTSGPFGTTDDVLGGKSGASERDRVAGVIDAALDLVTGHLRSRLSGEALHAQPVEVLAAAPAETLESVSRLLLQARAQCAGFVAPRLVLDGLCIRLWRVLPPRRAGSA